MANFFSKWKNNRKKEEKIQEKENQKIDKKFLDEYEELCFKYNRIIIPKIEYTQDAIIPRLEITIKKKDLPEMPKEEKVETKEEEAEEKIIEGTTSTSEKKIN